MLTPHQRKHIARSVDSALELVLSEVDKQFQQAAGLSRTPSLPGMAQNIRRRFECGAQNDVTLRIADLIAKQLSPEDFAELATGAATRKRREMRGLLRTTIQKSRNKSDVTRERDRFRTLSQQRDGAMGSMDWADYLRIMALLLNLIADIWDWYDGP